MFKKKKKKKPRTMFEVLRRKNSWTVTCDSKAAIMSKPGTICEF